MIAEVTLKLTFPLCFQYTHNTSGLLLLHDQYIQKCKHDCIYTCELLVLFQVPDNFVLSFGGQGRFNAVDITKWRIALERKKNKSFDNDDSSPSQFAQRRTALLQYRSSITAVPPRSAPRPMTNFFPFSDFFSFSDFLKPLTLNPNPSLYPQTLNLKPLTLNLNPKPL
jgi:hypothetical protein